jgi:hypothetical protein
MEGAERKEVTEKSRTRKVQLKERTHEKTQRV